MNFFANIGRYTLNQLAGIGSAFILLLRTLGVTPSVKGIPLLMQQLYRVGVLSLLIILVSGLFIGFVLGLQGYTTLVDYGSENKLGAFVAIILIRELGPVVTALLFAGRAGSALTAEIGQMKFNEELSVMEMMGVDPLRRIVAPRFWAALISLPMLSILFTAVGIYGGKIVGVNWLGVDEGMFWSGMDQAVRFGHDVVNGLIIKSLVFAFVCVWIAIYQGYTCVPSSEGISSATTRTVVYSSLCVLGLDFVLTAVMFGGLS